MLTPPLAHLSIHTYTCVCTATRMEFCVSHCAPGCRRRQRVTACTRPRGALGFSLARAPGLDVGPCLRAPCAPWQPRDGPDWRLGPSLKFSFAHPAPANHLGQEQRGTAQLLLGRRAGSRGVLVLSRSPGRSHLRPLLPCISCRRDRMPSAVAGGYHGRIR